MTNIIKILFPIGTLFLAGFMVYHKNAGWWFVLLAGFILAILDLVKDLAIENAKNQGKTKRDFKRVEKR